MAKKKIYQRPDGLYEKKVTINGKRVAFRGKTEREIDRRWWLTSKRLKVAPVLRKWQTSGGRIRNRGCLPTL